MHLGDTRPEYATSYSFVYGDTLLVGVEKVNATNALQVSSLNASDWIVRANGNEAHNNNSTTATMTMSSPAAGQLRFTAKAMGRTVELMPLNEVVEERYTVYYNLTVRKTASGK